MYGIEIFPGQVELLGEASIRLFRAEAIFERGFHQVVSGRGDLPGVLLSDCSGSGRSPRGASIRLLGIGVISRGRFYQAIRPVRTGYS